MSILRPPSKYRLNGLTYSIKLLTTRPWERQSTSKSGSLPSIAPTYYEELETKTPDFGRFSGSVITPVTLSASGHVSFSFDREHLADGLYSRVLTCTRSLQASSMTLLCYSRNCLQLSPPVSIEDARTPAAMRRRQDTCITILQPF